mmetsp:Transcript_44327/g.116479  ORF Transcript_44327/g.116479 Transcript_44327/m.116479 type:complete len:217 (-) Transcript_44327:190-840(-)
MSTTARGSVRRMSNENVARNRRTTSEKSGSQKEKPRRTMTSTQRAEEAKGFLSKRDEAKWKVSQKWAPHRELTERELTECRKLFFSLDRDGSGAVDADELGMMMRTLGQDPTEEEIMELILSVDESDDGVIQLREFVKLYAQGLDSKGKAGCLDSMYVFQAFGGDTKTEAGVVAASQVHDMIQQDFGLDVDFGETFGLSKSEFTQDDFKTIIGTNH